MCIVQKDKMVCKKDIVKSPLNYTGGKTKLLPQLLPLFPDKINTFVDLFCGGANVGINIKAKKVRYYDLNAELIGILNVFGKMSAAELKQKIESIIKKYELSQSEINGYEKYHCNSSRGLGSYNKEHFVELRNDFNKLEEKDDNYYLMLYVLIIYAFNNQIRFNKKHEFNLPVGKRDFNKNIQKNLNKFVDTLEKQEYTFECRDFREVDTTGLEKDDFVYCDPPYLITTASYNEQDGWTVKDERDLLEFLDKLNERRIRFALSNVMVHKGKRNEILTEWSKKYKVHNLNFSYNNSNYHGINTEKETQEVLITNY